MFDEAVEIAIDVEGIYSNNPIDKGHKTKYGITEKMAIAYGYAGKMEDLDQETAKKIYKWGFWDVMNLDGVAKYDQNLSEQLFLAGINMGPQKVGVWLQTVLNLLNRSGKLFKDIEVDGVIGKKTVAALYKLENGADKKVLNSIMRAWIISHYTTLCQMDQSQKVFIRGWVNRANRT